MFCTRYGGTKRIRSTTSWPQNLLTEIGLESCPLCVREWRVVANATLDRFNFPTGIVSKSNTRVTDNIRFDRSKPWRIPPLDVSYIYIYIYVYMCILYTYVNAIPPRFSRDTIYFNENWRESRWRKCRAMSLAIISCAGVPLLRQCN